MKKNKMILLTVAALAASVCVSQAQTLLVRMPFTDTGPGTTCASDTSTGGANVTLYTSNNVDVAADFHGTPGGGVSGLGVALDFSTNADFTIAGGLNVEGQGNGPIAANYASTALNFGTVATYTATIWWKANSIMNNAGNTGPRLFVLGANGISDKASANSVGLYWQGSNEIAATIDATEVNGPVNTGTFTVGQWYFYAVTYDGTTATIYQGTDGSAATSVASQAVAGGSITLNNASGSVLMVGNRKTLARPFDGWIDDFRFYSGVASANFVEDIRWSAVAPTNLVGTLVSGQSYLTWSPLGGAATYNISSSTTNGGPYTQIASGVTATNYTDTTVLTPDTTYYYVVSAVNSVGDQTTTTNSAQASVPPAPIAVLGTLEDGGVGLTWTDTDVTSYDILRSTSAAGPYVTIATGVTGTSYTDTTVATGVQYYYYEVVGVNGNGQTVPSSPAPVSYGQGNQLADPGFEASSTPGPWAEVGNQGGDGVTVTPGPTYYNAGTCPPDNPAEQIVTHSGTNVAKIYGSFISAAEFVSSYKQQVAATPLGTWAAGGWTLASHEDLMGGGNCFYYEVDFLGVSGNVLAGYESFIVTNLTCAGPNTFSLDTWVFLAVTNQMQVTAGVNTGVVIGNTGPSGVMTAPVGTSSVAFNVYYDQYNYGGGSMWFDDCELDLINGSLPPTLTIANLNNLTLCTNTSLTATAISTGGTITNIQAIIKTTPFGSTVSTTVTNNLNSFATGIGLSTAYLNYPLATNVIYNMTVIATDNAGNNVSAAANFDTISPTLVIEATDFDFTTNGVSGVFIDTPPNGGLFLYTNQVGTDGIDEHKNLANTSTKAAYRSGDEAVIQPAGSTTFNEQKFASAGVVELCVDYTSSFDWLNYTRTYGPGGSAPAGTYDVYLCMGTADSGIQSSLYQISGDPTSSDQATNFLGYFGTASFTDNNWAGYEYVPLTDQYGNLVSTTIPAGPQTLRIYQIANPNLEYLLLMPVTPILTPVLKYYYPDGVHPFEPTNHLTFTVGPANGSNILSSGIDLVVNGVDVTSTAGFSLTPSGDSWIANYTIKSNAVYSAIINVTNTAGLSSSFTNNFDTFNVNNFQWEAVDYDYTANGISGLFIDNPIPTCDVNTPQVGHLATNSYFGFPADMPGVSIALQGTDINFPNDGQGLTSEYYRADGVGSQPATDYLRPKFLAEQSVYSDLNIGPINIGYYGLGYWLNYTRTYPTNTFYVWGRLAGGAGPFSGTTLSIVTNGYGTATQMTNVLGTFSDPLAAGWQTWHWVPLLDANGNIAVVSLGGVATLKVTSGNNVNSEFFMLVPAPPAFAVTPTVAGGQITLSFLAASGHTYTVLFTSSLTPANWAPVGNVITGNGAVTNVAETLSGAQGYYTVGVQ